MMILRSSPPSPFGRKVKLALGILGLENEVTIEKADPTDASDTIRQQNPIGKIPALITEDGTVLYNSPVILEYLDHRAGGGKIIPKDANARFAALTLEAMCDGILDACILLVYEGRWRPAEMHVQKWIDYQADKVKRAFDVLEAKPPALDCGARCRTDHACLRARLSGLALRRKMARAVSETGEVARCVRGAGAGVCEDARDSLTFRSSRKAEAPARTGTSCYPSPAISTLPRPLARPNSTWT